MIKTVREISFNQLGLTDAQGNFTFIPLVRDHLPIARLVGEIMLTSNEREPHKYMGSFEVKDLMSGLEFSSYWIDIPCEIFNDLEYIRKKNYDSVSLNSQIQIVIKAQRNSKTSSNDVSLYIDSLSTLDR